MQSKAPDYRIDQHSLGDVEEILKNRMHHLPASITHSRRFRIFQLIIANEIFHALHVCVTPFIIVK